MINDYDIKIDETEDKAISEKIKKGVLEFYHGDRELKHFTLYIKDEHSNIIAGIVGSHLRNLLNANLAWVMENKRGQGLGKKLFAKLEIYAKEHNCHAIQLNTLHLEGKFFYEKLGYKLIGTLTEYYPGVNNYFMRKVL